MTLEEADVVMYVVSSIKRCKSLKSRINDFYQKGEIEHLATLALELNAELEEIFEDRLAKFPTLNS